MDLGLISVRYARALLKVSDEAKMQDAVYSDMQALVNAFVSVEDFTAALHNPMLSKEQKNSLFVAAVGGKPCSITEKFLDLVLHEGREDIMQFIATSFITLYRKHNNLVSARLQTAAALTPEVEKKLKHIVSSKTNGKVEFNSTINKDIIGGFILEYDTYRIDASVKSQLNDILSELN